MSNQHKLIDIPAGIRAKVLELYAAGVGCANPRMHNETNIALGMLNDDAATVARVINYLNGTLQQNP